VTAQREATRPALSSAERSALWQLAARGPITVGALAARLGVDRGRLGAHFGALRRRGYVRPDPQGVPDLTARGRRAVVALARARRGLP
jgi:Mn-dependent DtxR family transcriptional regulator